VTLAEFEEIAPNSTDVAIASANGSGTLLDPRQIRISRPGPHASVSTLLGPEQYPPAWVGPLVREGIPAKDDYGLIRLETLVRFAQACSALPNQTPEPYYGVGDDGTIGAEWDIGQFHIGIQIGNDPTVDSIIFEVDRGEPEESDNVGILPALMLSILPD
jgi:hypothetical protein